MRVFAVVDAIHLWVLLPFITLYPVTQCSLLHDAPAIKQGLVVDRAAHAGLCPRALAGGSGGGSGDDKGRTSRRGIGIQPNLIIRAPVNCTEQRSTCHVRVAG